MDTLQKITDKYNIVFTIKTKMPIDIPDVTRNDLGALFKELGFTVGVEVGTYEGGYAEELCIGNPDMKLYCVDPYKRTDGYLDYMDRTLRVARDTAVDRMKKYNCEFIFKTSELASNDFEDNSLNFVYIDGNHTLEHVIMDMSRWIKKIKVGGILAGHDFVSFRRTAQHHIVQAVIAYTTSYDIHPWFVLGDGGAQPGPNRDRYRSWMFVKK